MRKCLIELVLVMLMLTSCSTGSEDSNQLGIYEIEIAQSGDYDKFKLHASVSSEEGDGSLIYSDNGKSLGIYYILNEEDIQKDELRFYTTNKALGLLFTCSAFNINEVKRDSMSLFVKAYFNGRVILEKLHTFYSHFPDELYPDIVVDNSINIQLRDFK
ncbi:beta-barrel fold lipoprotein [Parabacteroides timonensis]|uniref:beta-barrel fold lipoprotein n=1 Tax=Parabacteroides timonensis TaxID=1871013 RepID=UPI00094E1937|nr:beta-barrel fold lipoprotein [Parabacteroides timonensis]